MRTLTPRFFLALAVALAGLCTFAQNPPAAKPHILVLGSFHMANPGKDMFNLQVDDVRSPKRQAEIAAFVESIKAFHPTKIALEVLLGDAQVNQHYQEYLAEKYTLTASESEQIGFRLAKELGHKQVYPINVMGDFPFDPVAEFAKKNGKEQLLNDMMASAPLELDEQAKILKTGTVGDLYRYINSEEQVRKGQALYMSMARFAGNGEYPGPDLLAEWYRRNVRIFSNLRNIIDSPEDRVLVIYGAGHEYWLQPPLQKGAAWNFVTEYNFGGPNGYDPIELGAVEGRDEMYGSTTAGGTGPCDGGCGTVFGVKP